MQPRDSVIPEVPVLPEGPKPEGPVFGSVIGPVTRNHFLYNIVFIAALYVFYKAFWEMKSPMSINLVYLLFLMFIMLILK